MNNNSDTKYHRLVFSFFRGICISHKYFYSFDYHLFHNFIRNSITSSLQCYVSYHHATYLLFRRKKNYNEINGTFLFSFPKITIHLSFVWLIRSFEIHWYWLPPNSYPWRDETKRLSDSPSWCGFVPAIDD